MITGGEVHYHQRDGEALDLLTLSAPELRAFRWQELSIVFQGAMNSSIRCTRSTASSPTYSRPTARR